MKRTLKMKKNNKMTRSKSNKHNKQDLNNKWVQTRKSKKSCKWQSDRLKTLMIPLWTPTECSRGKSNNWGRRIILFWIKQVRPQWMNTNIWTFWLRFTRPESNFNRPKIDTTECHFNFKINCLKSNLNATKSDRLFKTLRDKWLERLLTADQTSP